MQNVLAEERIKPKLGEALTDELEKVHRTKVESTVIYYQNDTKRGPEAESW